ncbi:MAG: ABC transporter permease, partial [Promethearchaeota archaeon]
MLNKKEKKNKPRGNFKASVSRVSTLTKKNLLRFWKNPKSLGFLIGIPIMYYLIIGLIFGSANSVEFVYSLGWVDDDSTTASTHPEFSLDSIYEVFDDIDEIEMHKYDSKDEATNAALEEEIQAFIYFPQGFEAYLEKQAYVDIALWNGDSSTSSKFNISSMLDDLKTQTASFFKITNETSTNFNNLLDNFDDSDFDGILVINNNFSLGLDNDWNVNLSYLYRDGLSIYTVTYIVNIITSTVNSYFHAQNYNSTINFIKIDTIPGTSQPEPINYKIYFLQSVSPTTKSIIENFVANIISNIINSNPLEIEIEYDVESTVGEEVNNITYQAPGLILYGPMTILSFVVIVLTSEKKDGIYKRLSSSEVKNWELITSSIFANMLLIYMQFAIGAFILYMFGWNPIIFDPLTTFIGVMLTIFLFSFFILALAYALTPIFKDPDTAGGGVWVIIIPLMMLSGIFFPIEFFGGWIKTVASVLPTRFAVLA